MKKLADYGRDDHLADDPDRAQLAWAVAGLTNCDSCNDLRVELRSRKSAGLGLVLWLTFHRRRRGASRAP